MKTLTFILGMERFNAHIWEEVERNLRQSGVAVRLLRFHDGMSSGAIRRWQMP